MPRSVVILSNVHIWKFMHIMNVVDVYFDTVIFTSCRVLQIHQNLMLFLYFQINVNDPLPKTVCLPCIDRLEAHHELIEQFTWATQRIAEAKAAKNSQVSTVGLFT